MGCVRVLVVGVLLGWAAVMVNRMLEEPPLPTLDPNPWWGPGEPKEDNAAVTHFKINIPEKDLKDLKDRLALPLRLTPALEGANFTYGFNSDTLSRIIDYWTKKYDWRKREAQLNKYPHYKTQIEGLDIHFLRAAAGDAGGRKDVKVVPLLMVHGWPGSVVEFYGILPLLTTPREGSSVVFEVICPSIPGYGFSQGSSKPGLGSLQTAQIFLKLMKRLGYDQFYVQGGDWGSLIVTDMATLFPHNILGVHVNMLGGQTTAGTLRLYAGSVLPSGLLVSKEDESHLYPISHHFSRIMLESGYAHIQATKPDTIGAVLNQSPVALATYILEKFSTWTHRDYPLQPDGGLLSQNFPLTMDSLLDNVCIYWFSGSITTSVRFYAENMNKDFFNKPMNKNACRVPSGVSMFPQDLLTYPKIMAEHKYHDLVFYRLHEKGGHFAAMECPELLGADLHEFITAVENRL